MQRVFLSKKNLQFSPKLKITEAQVEETSFLITKEIECTLSKTEAEHTYPLLLHSL